jgi:hypothetical protein
LELARMEADARWVIGDEGDRAAQPSSSAAVAIAIRSQRFAAIRSERSQN